MIFQMRHYRKNWKTAAYIKVANAGHYGRKFVQMIKLALPLGLSIGENTILDIMNDKKNISAFFTKIPRKDVPGGS